MKIVFFISSMAAGGSERQASLLCNHWAAAGHSVVLATLGDSASHYQLHQEIRLRVIPGTGGVRLRGMRFLIREETPDVVISFMDTTNVKVLIATRGMGVPVIVSERSVPWSMAGSIGVMRSSAFALLRRLFYPFSSALVVQTEAIANWARRRRLSRRVEIIPNAVAPPPSSTAEDPSTASRTVLAIGRLSPEKGFDILIRSFSLVAIGFPEWRLKIVGDGAWRPYLVSLVDSLNLYGRVELVPSCKDVWKEYRCASVVVLPSRFEGFPNVLIEAMQSGCAVITSDCPFAPREIVRNGHDALLFTNEDAEHLAECLRALLSDAQQRAALGTQARKSAQRYRPECILPLWDKLLDDIIEI